MSGLTDTDLHHLRRCVELAGVALAEGDEPFGSVLVGGDGQVLFEDHNRVKDGDATRHPELAIAQWAAAQLSPGARAAATVYTSGEHCAMCAAAHGWAQLGRIVYVVAGARLAELLTQWGAAPSAVATLPISAVAPRVPVEGPVPELAGEVEAMYARCFRPR